MDSSKIEFYKSSVEYILKVQNQDGSIPWEENKKLDPWDHIEAAMGLSVAGTSLCFRLGGHFVSFRSQFEWCF